MHPSVRPTVCSCLLLAAAAPLGAQPVSAFDIPAGPLSDSIALLSRQAGIDLGGIDLVRVGARAARVRGRMDVDQALAAMLAGTGLAAQRVAPGAYRIVRAAPVAVVRTPRTPRPPPPAPPAAPGEIVVTAGKREVPLSRYPGSTMVVDLAGDDARGPSALEGTSYLVRQTPILQSTELGAGRNKLFIRGIADSSFTGPTQATASTYFGDVRMGYNGPDPHLALYDMKRAEVLEGPQGTLYGAGSIGGVIRLTPQAPALRDTAATVDAGVTATQGGGLGNDAAAMLNVPLGKVVAVRAVAYRRIEGGFIDDVARRLGHINETRTRGLRGAVRIAPAAGWTADASVVVQSIAAPDLQYAVRSFATLSRASATAQPFRDDYVLARGTLDKKWDNGLTLVMAGGRVWHDTSQRYDATRANGVVLAYDEANRIRMTSGEVRLSRADAGGVSWVIGASLVADTTAKARRFGLLATQRDIVGVTNQTRERALFGEATTPVGPRLALTVGGRLTRARMDGEPDTRITQTNLIRGQSSRRIDPTFGATYRIDRRLSWYSRYSQGFRTAGLAVARGIGRVANYESDTIRVGETGLKLARAGATGFSATTTLSYARWKDIQADLIDRIGFPYTANLGNGRIAAVEGAASWIGRGGWHASSGVLLTRSKLTDAQPDFASSVLQTLPDTPRVTLTAAGGWKGPIATGRTLSLEGGLRYVGHSSLGLGPTLDIAQGDYLETNLAGRLTIGGYGVSIDIGNLFDARSNRFAIGNPFGIAARNQYTPQRPRNIRIGLSAAF